MELQRSALQAWRQGSAHVLHRRAPISIVKDYLVSAVGEQLLHVAAVPTVGSRDPQAILHPRTRPSVCALRGTPRATRATRRPAWRRRWSRPCTEGWPGRRRTMIELPSGFDDSIFRSAAAASMTASSDLLQCLPAPSYALHQKFIELLPRRVAPSGRDRERRRCFVDDRVYGRARGAMAA